MKEVSRGSVFTSFAELADAMGVKPRKVDEVRRKAQQEKLCKCAKCGEQMDYIRNSNVIVCHNVIEEGGRTRICKNTRLLTPDVADYAAALFA